MIDSEQFETEIERIIQNAIKEDVGEGDHTSLSCIPENEQGKAQLLVKESGIIAGVAFATQVFKNLDPDLQVELFKKDGDKVAIGEVVFHVSGRAQSILQAERLVLNAMQRMSAIATKTDYYVDLLKGTNTKILDTRKTTPGIRALEKWAVKIGGGVNHRFALYDMIMIKDNHIDFSGGITRAIDSVKQYLIDKGLDLKIIVEARNLDEIKEILENEGVYRILIDNFSFEDTRAAVTLINGKCLIESSGGINEETLRKYAACGVDYISSGALTHSVFNMDLSLKAL